MRKIAPLTEEQKNRIGITLVKVTDESLMIQNPIHTEIIGGSE